MPPVARWVPIVALALAPTGVHADLGPCTSVRTRPFVGRFQLWQPLYRCRQAPCPARGGLTISLLVPAPGLQPAGRAPRALCEVPLQSYRYDRRTPATLRLPLRRPGEAPSFIVIDGEVDLAGRPAVATIVAHSARYSDVSLRSLR